MVLAFSFFSYPVRVAEIWTKIFELGKGKKKKREMKREPPINPEYGEDDWRSRYPPWWHAIVGRNKEHLKRLLDEGLDPSRLVPDMGNPNVHTSPLAYIVGSCHGEMLKLAAPYCSDINSICSTLSDGRAHTPLQRALLCSTHWEMARILIDNGAVLTDDMVEKAKEMDKDRLYPIPFSSDRVIYDFWIHVSCMKATAWCMRHIGDVWPDMIEIAVRDRMGNDEFATDLYLVEGEDDSSDSWRWSDDSSSSVNNSDEEAFAPRKRQKM